MAGTKPLLNRQEAFLVFCVILSVIITLVVFMNWNANSYYVKAYAPVVENAQERQGRRSSADSPEARASNQPARHGIRESDIEKQEGKRFRAF